MRYQTASAFRQALESRLLNRSRETGEPLIRLRKLAAFERLLARFFTTQKELWVLKGGVAMQLRLLDQARTTKDLDLFFRKSEDDLLTLVRQAGSADLGDWFLFEIAAPSPQPGGGFGGTRFRVNSLLDGRSFTRFPLDVGVGDPLIGSVEWLAWTGLFDFAELERFLIPAYSVSQQIAEKVHAYTMEYASGSSSRVKDLIDILLLAGMAKISARDLRSALRIIFEFRGTHGLPPNVPPPPEAWRLPYQVMVEKIDLPFRTLSRAYPAFQSFLDPVLSGETESSWDPEAWRWK